MKRASCALAKPVLKRKKLKYLPMMGSGWGSVGRLVASDTRGQPFNSSGQPNFMQNLYSLKDEIKKKETRNGHEPQ